MRIRLILATIVCFGISPLSEADEIPPNFRIQVKTIRTSPANADAILKLPSSTNARHSEAKRLIAANEAELVHSSSVVARPGGSATLDVGFLHAHFLEDQPHGPPVTLSPLPKPTPFHTPMPRPILPPSMESRNVGLLMEFNGLNRTPDGDYSVRIGHRWVTLGDPKVIVKCIDEWGDGSLKTPVFHETATNTTVTLNAGKFTLVSVSPSLPAPPPPAPPQKILLFMRLDMIPD